MELTDLLKLKPKLHDGPKGEPYSWQISDDVLNVIDKYVNQTSNTLETGAGVSTLLFAVKRAKHVCIVPFEKEVFRIKAFCKEHNISLDKLQFEVDFSEDVLPRVELGELDLVLIDGAHGFPMPFIDWYYGAAKLKIGGILIIDDTQLWTGHVLKMFLLGEPEWQLEVDYAPRCVVFKKIKDGGFRKNEFAQPYVVEQTINLLYPNHVNLLHPYVSPDLLLAKERRTLEIFENNTGNRVAKLLDLFEQFETDSNTTLSKVEAGVIVDSKSDDPKIVLPYSLCGRDKLVRISIDAPCDTYLQLYYMTTDKPNYTEQHSIMHRLLAGNNEILISMVDNKATGRLRVDPGAKQGKYLIKSLEIVTTSI